MKLENILVVEDDPFWEGIYARNIRPPGRGALRLARTLEQAREALEEMAFAAAFVDVRLDENDHLNTDGLEVMKVIADLGEATSVIMVTGTGDVGITRDALKEYGAFDAVDKSIDPPRLRDLLHQALVAHDRAHDRATSSKITEAAEALSGAADQAFWDGAMLRDLSIRGGIAVFYDFLNRLVSPFLPLVPRVQNSPVVFDPGATTVSGDFWSRGAGRAVHISFGPRDGIDRPGRVPDQVPEAAQGSGYPDEILREATASTLKGAVFGIPGLTRSDFPL